MLLRLIQDGEKKLPSANAAQLAGEEYHIIREFVKIQSLVMVENVNVRLIKFRKYPVMARL